MVPQAEVAAVKVRIEKRILFHSFQTAAPTKAAKAAIKEAVKSAGTKVYTPPTKVNQSPAKVSHLILVHRLRCICIAFTPGCVDVSSERTKDYDSSGEEAPHPGRDKREESSEISDHSLTGVLYIDTRSSTHTYTHSSTHTCTSTSTRINTDTHTENSYASEEDDTRFVLSMIFFRLTDSHVDSTSI